MQRFCKLKVLTVGKQFFLQLLQFWKPFTAIAYCNSRFWEMLRTSGKKSLRVARTLLLYITKLFESVGSAVIWRFRATLPVNFDMVVKLKVYLFYVHEVGLCRKVPGFWHLCLEWVALKTAGSLRETFGWG